MKEIGMKQIFAILMLLAAVVCLWGDGTAAYAQDDPKTYYNLGLDYEKKGMDEAAMEAYEKALDAFAANNDFSSEEVENTLGRLRNLYFKNEKLDKIIELLSETAKHSENLSQEQLAQLYYGLGTTYTKKGMYTESINEFQKMLQINPEPDASVYYYLGNDFKNLSDKQKAIENYNRYLELSPAGDFSKDAEESLKQLTGQKDETATK